MRKSLNLDIKLKVNLTTYNRIEARKIAYKQLETKTITKCEKERDSITLVFENEFDIS